MFESVGLGFDFIFDIPYKFIYFIYELRQDKLTLSLG
jgi:hypothetical protein